MAAQQIDTTKLNDYCEVCEGMIIEIDDWQVKLDKLNDQLLSASGKSSSMYGDHMLEFSQKKLFHLKRVLKSGRENLKKHISSLQELIQGNTPPGYDEYEKYQEFCHRTATVLQNKLTKLQSEVAELVA